ncbi:hypothetical protein H4R18_000454, partial [Coemansia javaensis]
QSVPYGASAQHPGHYHHHHGAEDPHYYQQQHQQQAYAQDYYQRPANSYAGLDQGVAMAPVSPKQYASRAAGWDEYQRQYHHQYAPHQQQHYYGHQHGGSGGGGHYATGP